MKSLLGIPFESPQRILFIDDDHAASDDFRRILAPQNDVSRPGDGTTSPELATAGGPKLGALFDIDFAFPGAEGVDRVQQAQTEGRPYVMVFVDVPMPAGSDRWQIVSKLWEICPELEVVLCAAQSDGQLEEIIVRLGRPDQLMILRKPFDAVEVRQLAHSLAMRWRSAQKVRDRLNHLEELVRDRTASLRTANQKRHEESRRTLQFAATAAAGAARKATDIASQANSEFLAMISHEIRTPMCGVLGYASLLLDTPMNEEQRTFTRTIKDSGEILLNLLNDILDWSKIEAGKLRIVPSQFDLSKAIKEVIALTAFRARAKNLNFVSVYPARVPRHLVADPGRVRQVLLNLVTNALKFTAAGSVTIHVTEVTPSRQYDPIRTTGSNVLDTSNLPAFLRIEVIDTGIGIPKHQQDLLFNKFTQADASIAREFGGTGLGLSISKQLVELMGGQVGLESEPHRGSTFWFTLPLIDRSSEMPSSHPMPARHSRSLAIA